MNLQEKIDKYLGESKKGEGEFKKMKKIVNNVFTNNEKFDFEVKEYPSIGSFTIKGDIKTILQVLESTIGNPQKLFADYGYNITKYPSQNTVLLKNFDLFIDNKWKSIWKN